MELHIPRSVADTIALPEARKAQELQRELAVALYREDLLSFGKARELARLDVYGFAQLLGERGVPRHYGDDELDDDLNYAQDKP